MQSRKCLDEDKLDGKRVNAPPKIQNITCLWILMLHVVEVEVCHVTCNK